LKKHLLNFSNL